LTTLIRALVPDDLPAVARIHAEAFPRQQRSEEWIACNARAFPRCRYFVAEVNGTISGYILWTERSGFRTEVVLELEQIAVGADMRRHGIGADLIGASLSKITEDLRARGSSLRAVMVTTRSDNEAQRLYRRVLGAEIEATLKNLFAADEVVMIAHDPCGRIARWAPEVP
jgi:ribosomal protein S18 acetylase RimI-like enzyme